MSNMLATAIGILFIAILIPLATSIVALRNIRSNEKISRVQNNLRLILSFLVFTLIFSAIFIGILYSQVGTPQKDYVNASYYPFSDGELYEKVWDSKREKQLLFSVAKISLQKTGTIFPAKDIVLSVKKDTFPEIFSRSDSIPSKFFVVSRKRLHSVTEEQMRRILKLGLSGEQAEKFIENN